MTESIVFDQAAEFYDATRGLQPETFDQVLKLLSSELTGRGNCLEIGIGTGRIALPLVDAGIRVIGIDLSTAMLAKLRQKKSDLPVLLADAGRLPFFDDSFGTGLAVHVLHLVGDWQRVAAEMVRVVRPGGVILIDLGGRHGMFRQIEEQFTHIAGIERARPGITDPQILDQYMRSLGARARELPEIIDSHHATPDALLQALAANLFSVTWKLEEAERLKASTETREWAVSEFGDLSEPRPQVMEIRYRAYDLL